MLQTYKPLTYYIKNTLYMTLPVFIEAFLGSFVDLVGLHFIGKSGTDEDVGGVGIGLMVSNILVLSVLYGFLSAFQTLGSQSFGKKDYYMCSVYHWRSRILTLILYILLSAILLFSKHIFLFFKIQPDIAETGSKFSRYMIIYNFINSQVEVTYIHMQNQIIYKPQMIIGGIVTGLTPFMQYFLIVYMGYGALGLAISKISNQIVILTTLIIYIQVSKCCGETWKLPNKDAIKGWKQLIRLGIDGILMVCLEWWTFEILNFISAFLGPIVLAANVVLANTLNLFFKIGVSFGVGALSLIGNSVGDKREHDAKQYLKSVVICDLIMVILVGIPCVIIPRSIAMLYTNDEAVLKILVVYIPIVYFFEMMDSELEVLTEVFAAVRMQNYAYKTNIAGYYMYAIPLAILNIYVLKWGLSGIYFAYIAGSFIRMMLLVLKLYELDWKQTIKECHDKLDYDSNELEEN